MRMVISQALGWQFSIGFYLDNLQIPSKDPNRSAESNAALLCPAICREHIIHSVKPASLIQGTKSMAKPTAPLCVSASDYIV